MDVYRPYSAKSMPRDMDTKAELTLDLDGPELCSVDVDDLLPSSNTQFKDVKLVGGYNWIEGKQPSILVPGLPDLWGSGTQGRLGQLKPDISIPGYKELGNQNAYRLLPKISPLEPIFHSLDSPDALSDTELITDRSCLRKLLQMFTPDALNGQKPFRINAQAIGGTVLFTRTESDKLVAPQDPHPFCFAKSHQLATCEQQVENITSCHRIVRYSFGGIKMMVRFELDAVSSIPLPDSKIKSNPTSQASEDDLVKLMGNTSVNSSFRPLPQLTEKLGGINIHRSTFPTPALSTFIECKTRSVRGQLDYTDIYGQLVFSQTPNLYIARHFRGNFQSLEKVKLGEGRLAGIASATDEALGSVAALLAEMIQITKENGGVSFVWSGRGMKLGVWEFDNHAPLSEVAKGMLNEV